MKPSGEIRLFVGIVVVALLLVGVALYPMLSNPSGRPPGIKPPTPIKASRSLLVPKGSHMQGDPKAPYTLVEFGDYDCASCARAAVELKPLLPKYSDRMSYVYHHYQVAQAHMTSQFLFEAAEAAALQGKFWEMHEALFAASEKLSNPSTAMNEVLRIAQELHLDMLRFRSDIDKGAGKKAVDRDRTIGEALRITVTPSFCFVPPKGDPTVITGGLPELRSFLANPKNWEPKP